jgi:hypothetical protein
MKIESIAISGIRVCGRELLQFGLTLPWFAEPSKTLKRTACRYEAGPTLSATPRLLRTALPLLAVVAAFAAGLHAQELQRTQRQASVSADTAVPRSGSRAEESDSPRKHIVSIGGGAAVAGADLRSNMSSAFLLRTSYAWRFHRFFQAETGLDASFGSAGIDRREHSAVGNIKITDSEYFVPFGASAVLPLAKGRLELTAGGGGAYLYYNEEAGVPEGVNVYCPYGGCSVTVDCPSCKSRGGWGYYGSGSVAFPLDRRRRVWLNFTCRYFRGATSGQSLGAVQAGKTLDQWLAPTIGVSGRF